MTTAFARCLSVISLLIPAIAGATLTESEKQAVVVKLTQNTGAEYRVTVESGRQVYRFATLLPDFQAAGDAVKSQPGIWKGDFLFVRQQCGSPVEWRCTVDQVFTRQQGNLVHLGAVESRACVAAPAAPGCGYDPATEVFNDVYDGLQTNPVTGRIDSPPVRIARRVEDGVFKTDQDLSWQLNRPLYRKSIACLKSVAAKGFAVPCEDKMEAWSALVFAAKASHYTGREAERTHLFDRIAVDYCAKSADPQCAKRVAGLKHYTAGFPPGDAPKYVPFPVRSVTSADADPASLQPQPLGAVRAIPLKLAP